MSAHWSAVRSVEYSNVVGGGALCVRNPSKVPLVAMVRTMTDGRTPTSHLQQLLLTAIFDVGVVTDSVGDTKLLV